MPWIPFSKMHGRPGGWIGSAFMKNRAYTIPVRPRPRFRFEAKRLGSQHRVSAYLGKDGLGCFLDGRYARTDAIAGMLGYVQDGTASTWADKIGRVMAKTARETGLLKSSPWRREQLVAELDFTYRSGHARPTVGLPIEIYHTLLLFN